MIYPTNASLLMCEDCNLACDYCFELGQHKKNKMSNDIIYRSLEFLTQNAIQSDNKDVSLMFFGGEPLLNIDGIEYAYQQLVEFQDKYTEIHFSCSTVTNGTLMNDKIFEVYNKYSKLVDSSIQVSVDGIKDIHDSHRVNKNGDGTFDLIQKNIEKWKEIFGNKDGRLHLHGCLVPETLKYLYVNWQYFTNVWNIPFQWYMPIHSVEYSDNDVKIYEEELFKCADVILAKIRATKNLEFLDVFAPLSNCYQYLNSKGFSKPCGAGNTFISITADGEIYPCHQIYYNDETKTTQIGSLLNEDLYHHPILRQARCRVYEEYGHEDMSCDNDCECYTCYRCIADNFRRYGSFFTQIRGNRCRMSHIERKVQLYILNELKGEGMI